MLKQHASSSIEEVTTEWMAAKSIRLFIKREDMLHPLVSGNKWRKLKYNLRAAREQGHDTLLTFGGAYSNHIYATAAAAKEGGFKSIGIIRGEAHELLNPTLTFAKTQGMTLDYLDRTTYRDKANPNVMQLLSEKHGKFYLLPEGGTNNLAIKGCEEMVDKVVRGYDCVCLPVGTGGTISGIIAGMEGCGEVLGFSALKGDFLRQEVADLLAGYGEKFYENWDINVDYHFGGYAKMPLVLLDFIEAFEQQHGLFLDPVYTGKMMFGIFDLIRRDYFEPGHNILAIHTGGLQGRLK